MKKHLAIVVLIFFVGTTQLFSQVSKISVVVKGQVVDSVTNDPVPYATIKIMGSSPAESQPIKALAADESGKFQVKLDQEGTYSLVVHFLGKTAESKMLQVGAGAKEINLGKILMKDDNSLEEVVVTAFKPLVKVDLDKISYSTEDDPDAKTNNVLEMLKKVPMVTVDAEDKIQLKGNASFKIYLDGKPSNLISNNPSDVLKSMPANTVKTIEVITDPGAKYDAEGVTGIINIVTNKQPMGGYNVSLSAGLDSRNRYNLGAYGSMKYGKIGFTGNFNYYNYNNSPSDSYTYREDYESTVNKYLNQTGTNKNKGSGQYGYGELSYEIDTLNLLSMGFSRYGGKNTGETDFFVEMQDNAKNLVYSYNQNRKNLSDYGSTDMNVDYQRTFSKKDELLTASYRLSLSPNNSESESAIDSVFHYANSKQNQSNDADMKEHTFQLDYTTPIAKIHTIEGGVKYIIRINESNSGHDWYNFNTSSWNTLPQTGRDQFEHRQDILSAYLGYNVKVSKYGFKAGLRMEETNQQVDFPLNDSLNFDSDYFNLIPSTTFSYQLNPMQTFRLGYNMRIQRPGIWYLNPYINTSDPKYISTGNPNLDVEKSHNFNLNYSLFNQKFNMNTSLYYNYTGNSIQQITDIRNDISYSTFENIGVRKETGLNFYINWNPTMKLRLSGNLSGSYVDIRANNNSGLVNYGFSENLHGNAQYSFPRDFSLSLYGGYGSPNIGLRGEYSGYHYSGLGLNKSFLEKKLTLSVSATNIFEKTQHYGSIEQTDQYYYKTESNYPSRGFRFSVSYRFGEMKQQIQKARRGISNDDTKGAEGGGGGAAAGGGGGGQ